MSKRLHLLPGASAARSASVAFPDDAIAHIHDTFTEGPVPPLDTSPTLRDWLGRRLNYWSSFPDNVQQSDFDPEEAIDDFCATFARLGDFDEVVLWVADCLGESLFVCWAIAAADAMGFDTSRWRIAFPDAEPMRGRWTYLGACEPENFKGGTWRPWADSELDAARDAWRAFTALSPEPLRDFLADLPDVEFLASLRYLIDRYPDKNSGLDIWEQRLLKRLAQHVEITVCTIANVLGYGWEDSHDLMGDRTLFHRLLELSDPNIPRPLLRRWGTGTSMRTTFFALTEFGEAVIEGDKSRLDMLGLDRWIGGIHLDATSGEVWCRDGSMLTHETFPNAPSHAAKPTLSPIAAPKSYSTDEVHLVVGNGFRVLAPVLPNRRVWALPPIPAEQHGPIGNLGDWMREGKSVFAAEGVEHTPNVTRADTEFDAFEACLASAGQIRMWLGGSIRAWLVLGGVACKIRSLGRDPDEVLHLYEVEGATSDQSVHDIHPFALEHTDCHSAGATIQRVMAVWDAFVASTPDALQELLNAGSHEPPIGRLLTHLIEPVPDLTTGLTQVQAEALRCIDENNWRTFHKSADVAQMLADPALNQPLLSRTTMEAIWLPSSFELTKFGRRVLAGEANYTRANGIDGWIGGMHLSTKDGQMWWRSGDVIVREEDPGRA